MMPGGATTSDRLATIVAHLRSKPVSAGPSAAPTDVLVRATRPAIRGQPEASPVQWGAAEWGALAREQEHSELLDRQMLREIDRSAFLREGIVVLPGVMSRPAELIEALSQAQSFNDSVVQHAPRWPEAIDWLSLGAQGPPTGPTLSPSLLSLSLSLCV